MLSPTVTSCGANFLSKTGGYLGSADQKKAGNLKQTNQNPRLFDNMRSDMTIFSVLDHSQVKMTDLGE